jgi:hypothetical protein
VYDVVVARPCRISTVPGDIRRVTSFDALVNPENTERAMAWVTDHSISTVIRYEGAEPDPAKHVTNDLVAGDLRRATDGRRPVAPATVIPTDAGQLRQRLTGVRPLQRQLSGDHRRPLRTASAARHRAGS